MTGTEPRSPRWAMIQIALSLPNSTNHQKGHQHLCSRNWAAGWKTCSPIDKATYFKSLIDRNVPRHDGKDVAKSWGDRPKYAGRDYRAPRCPRGAGTDSVSVESRRHVVKYSTISCSSNRSIYQNIETQFGRRQWKLTISSCHFGQCPAALWWVHTKSCFFKYCISVKR